MTKIAIVTGSTRPGRVNKRWPTGFSQTAARTDADFEVVDIADFNLPLLDEAYPAAYQNYQNDHTKAWSAKISEFDGFIFVTGEYNHTVYPGTGQRPVLPERRVQQQGCRHRFLRFHGWRPRRRAPAQHPVRTADRPRVRNQVMFSLFTDFENFADFKPTEQNAGTLAPMIDQLIPWTKAMESVRAAAVAAN